jgi:hypothetical protein
MIWNIELFCNTATIRSILQNGGADGDDSFRFFSLNGFQCRERYSISSALDSITFNQAVVDNLWKYRRR